MVIKEFYNIVAHPMAKEHDLKQVVSSLVINVALTILTKGLYLLAFGAAHLIERVFYIPPNTALPKTGPRTKIDRNGFLGVAALKAKQADHLAKLKNLE